jgi:hypothetical protein
MADACKQKCPNCKRVLSGLMGLKAHLSDRFRFSCLYDPRAFSSVDWSRADEKDLTDLLVQTKKMRQEMMEPAQMRRGHAAQEAEAEAEAAEGSSVDQNTDSCSTIGDGIRDETAFSHGFEQGYDRGFRAGAQMLHEAESSAGSELGRNVRSRLH